MPQFGRTAPTCVSGDSGGFGASVTVNYTNLPVSDASTADGIRATSTIVGKQLRYVSNFYRLLYFNLSRQPLQLYGASELLRGAFLKCKVARGKIEGLYSGIS